MIECRADVDELAPVGLGFAMGADVAVWVEQEILRHIVYRQPEPPNRHLPVKVGAGLERDRKRSGKRHTGKCNRIGAIL